MDSCTYRCFLFAGPQLPLLSSGSSHHCSGPGNRKEPCIVAQAAGRVRVEEVEALYRLHSKYFCCGRPRHWTWQLHHLVEAGQPAEVVKLVVAWEPVWAQQPEQMLVEVPYDPPLSSRFAQAMVGSAEAASFALLVAKAFRPHSS